jgi:hypothetical protein
VELGVLLIETTFARKASASGRSEKFFLVKRIQRAVPYSARNICAKMFQVLGGRGLRHPMQVLEFNGYSPERYPATHFKDKSAHQKHTEKVCVAQKKGE